MGTITLLRFSDPIDGKAWVTRRRAVEMPPVILHAVTPRYHLSGLAHQYQFRLSVKIKLRVSDPLIQGHVMPNVHFAPILAFRLQNDASADHHSFNPSRNTSGVIIQSEKEVRRLRK